VIYFKGGKIVFAVSNARTPVCFDILMRRKRLTKEDLSKIPNFSNDFELAAHLEDKKLAEPLIVTSVVAEQIEGIIVDVFM